MKKGILLIFSLLSIGSCIAQVGINTQNPQAIFHLDGKGDTSASNNFSDDIIIATDDMSGVNIALGGLPVKGASITLHSKNKGFLPNRVSLTSSLDVTTIPSPVVGMVVYNIMSSGTYPTNTIPGYYYYDGARWQRLRTNAYLGMSDTRTLQMAVTTLSTTATGATELNAPELDFGTVQVFEDGAYALSFNISGTSSTETLAQPVAQSIIYIYVLRKGVDDTDFSYYKTIQYNPPLFPNGASITMSTITGLELRAQDELKFTSRHYASGYSLTYQPVDTFMTYWKL